MTEHKMAMVEVPAKLLEDLDQHHQQECRDIRSSVLLTFCCGQPGYGRYRWSQRYFGWNGIAEKAWQYTCVR